MAVTETPSPPFFSFSPFSISLILLLYCILSYLPNNNKNTYVYIKTGVQMFIEAAVRMAQKWTQPKCHTSGTQIHYALSRCWNTTQQSKGMNCLYMLPQWWIWNTLWLVKKPNAKDNMMSDSICLKCSEKASSYRWKQIDSCLELGVELSVSSR